MCKHDVIHEPEVHNLSQRRQRTTQPHGHGQYAQKFGEGRTCTLFRRYARDTRRQTHRNTLISSIGASRVSMKVVQGCAGVQEKSHFRVHGDEVPWRLKHFCMRMSFHVVVKFIFFINFSTVWKYTGPLKLFQFVERKGSCLCISTAIG